MDIETDLNAEIEQLEYAANFLKARANSLVKYAYDSGEYDHQRAGTFVSAAKLLEASDKLQGRANILSMSGRDYRPADFAEEEAPA